MQIHFNTFIFNKENLNQAEVSLLARHPDVLKDEKLLAFCHHENVWNKLASHFTTEEQDGIRSILTDITKAYATVSGLTEMNIPPYGVAYNPAPNWLKIKIESNNVFIEHKKS